MKNILCPVNYSNHAEKIINEAATFARAFGSKLWIIHVAAPDPDFVGHETGPQYQRDWIASKLREEHRYIQDEANRLEKEGLQVTPLLLQGATVETILHEIDKLNIDLVVMGSHGHGTFYSILVESVSKEVIKKVKCPVVIIPIRE